MSLAKIRISCRETLFAKNLKGRYDNLRVSELAADFYNRTIFNLKSKLGFQHSPIEGLNVIFYRWHRILIPPRSIVGTESNNNFYRIKGSINVIIAFEPSVEFCTRIIEIAPD